MKALTIRQPWASLIALGVKTIETRSWSTSYRGPLAIHAGKGEAPTNSIGRFTNVTGEPIADGHERAWLDCAAYRVVPCPLGEVVAVVDLLDVVPMVDDCDDLPDTPACIEVLGPSLRLWADGAAELGDEVDVSDQLPFGVFAPGRYAWLLGNVRPLDPPVPVKGKQGLWTWEDPR